MLIKTELICDIGCIRQKNEDIILLNCELFRDKSYENKFEFTERVRFAAIVADGMGGHSGGEVASEIVVQQFDEFVLNLPENLNEEELTKQIKDWTQKTHQHIIGLSIENQELQGMGSTFCGLFFYEKIVLALNIGDSRTYRFRDGILKKITLDHSMRELTGDQSVPVNYIYNSFGAGDEVFIDVKNISEQIFENDLFLICSDGLSDMVSDVELEIMLADGKYTQEIALKAKEAGGKDNISIIILKISDL